MNQLTLLNLSQAEKALMLEGLSWAHDLTAQQIEKLAFFFKPYSAFEGATILKEAQKNDFFCLICEGRVDVFKTDVTEKSKHLQTLGVGAAFGEMSFFDGGSCSASILAKSEVTLLLMDKSGFKKLCSESPAIALQIAVNLISNISQRLRQTTGRLIDSL